jgi:hypothetical protein
MRKSQYFKYIEESLSFIDSIEKQRSYKVISDSPIINGTEVNVFKMERCFKFTSGQLNIVPNMIQYNTSGYGFFQNLTLSSTELKIDLDCGIPSINGQFGDDLIIAGEIHSCDVSFDSTVKSFYRAIIPKSENPNDDVDNYVYGVVYNMPGVGSRGFTEFQCDGKEIHLFTYYNEERPSIFIDCMESIDFSDFERIVESIVTCFGVISGYTPRDEIYFLQSTLDNSFKKINGLRFNRLNDSIKTGMEIIAPGMYSQLIKSQNTVGHISPEIFGNFVTNSYIDIRFFRGLKIISEANQYPLEIRASGYSVALETIRNVIMERHEEKSNPIKQKSVARRLIGELKEIVDTIDDSEFNNRDIIIKKLENLNQVTNKDSFKLAFDVCGFKIMPLDESALLKRNDFLHGRIPFEDEVEKDHAHELKFVTYKLHFLVVGLALKYSGYSGLLKNNPAMFKYTDGEEKIEEALFRFV